MGGIQGQNKDGTLKCISYTKYMFCLCVFYTNFRDGDARCKGPSLFPKTTENEGEANSTENISQRHIAKWLHTRDNAQKLAPATPDWNQSRSFRKDTLPIGCLREGSSQRQRQKTGTTRARLTTTITCQSGSVHFPVPKVL